MLPHLSFFSVGDRRLFSSMAAPRAHKPAFFSFFLCRRSIHREARPPTRERQEEKKRDREAMQKTRVKSAPISISFFSSVFFHDKNSKTKRPRPRDFFFLFFWRRERAAGRRCPAPRREKRKRKQKATKGGAQTERDGRVSERKQKKRRGSDGRKGGKTAGRRKRGPQQSRISFPPFFTSFLWQAGVAPRPRRSGRRGSRARGGGARATARPTRIRAP